MEDQEPEPELEAVPELEIGHYGFTLSCVFFTFSLLIFGINLFVGK